MYLIGSFGCKLFLEQTIPSAVIEVSVVCASVFVGNMSMNVWQYVQ